MNQRFYVLVTGINQEGLAQQGLRAKGFETYYPMGRRVVRHARRQIVKTFPVFSRYIFVRFDIAEQEWSDPIRSTDGVLDILANNYQPIEVPTEIIDEIKQRESQGKFDIIPSKPKKQRWAKSFEILKNLLNADALIQV